MKQIREHKKENKSKLTGKRQKIWSIGLFAGPTPFQLTPMHGVTNPIISPKDIPNCDTDLVADPFMIKVGSVWYLFFEVYDRTSQLGKIALTTSTNLKDWSYQGVVLEESFHLSYPYVFEWGGTFYMIPETLGLQSLNLYQATQFPFAWARVATLLKPAYADVSLLRHQDKWWLFAAAEPYPFQENLALFYADQLPGRHL